MKDRFRPYLYGILGSLIGCLGLVACERADPVPADVAQPMSPHTRQLLMGADEALSRQDFELAFVYVDSAEAQAPGLADIPFLRGRIYAELLRLDEADSAYQEVLAIRPSYPGVWNNLGNTSFRRQEYSQAIRHYRKELEAHPDARPWRGIAKAYVELGKIDSARFAFERALASDSTFDEAYFGLALLLEDTGDLEGALDASRQAFEYRPQSMEYRYHVGALLVKLGRYDEALGLLQEVADRWPWHQGAHYNMAQALMRLGRLEEASAVQGRAEELRRLQSQISNHENAVRVQPDNPFAHAGLASVLRRAARYGDALHAYKVALYLAPDNLEFRNNVAVLHLLQQDTMAAIRTFEQIVRFDSTNVTGWFNLGSLYAMSGEPDKARAAWLTALRFDPQNDAIHRALERLPSP